MKTAILTLLVSAVSFYCWADPPLSDSRVLLGQPSIFWHQGQWQTWKDGVWTPYGQSAADPAQTLHPETHSQPASATDGRIDRAQAGRTTGHTAHGRRGLRRGRPAAGIGQATGQSGEPNLGIGQTTIGIGQQNLGIGQSSGIGQTTIGIGQPNAGLGKPNSIGQTTIGIGKQVESFNQQSGSSRKPSP
jgi:hypothetical protein